jgi:toxin ParE1/3/4
MQLRVSLHADLEFEDACKYYEACSPGLGARLLRASEQCVSGILDRPARWRKFSGRYRRALVDGFPYGVIYAIHDETVYVIAFMHLHRRPGYWKDRLPPPG